ncbi:hypothetical protein BDB01DRAFT_729376 [Pilobolus umbonatus]|nr:hypothetical protein BDB01DRAFT_729376 [Pilobolus umbonatus]
MSLTKREEQRCWICFGDASDSQGQWVKPCQCSLEAHQTCLLDWIAENQKGSITKKCSTTYHLSQHSTVRLAFMALVDAIIRASAPYVAVLGVGCSVFITCTTYGAFSVMTLFGPRDGERLIGNPAHWTWRSWLGLPLIPFLLFSTKTRWGDVVLPVTAMTLLRASGYTHRTLKLTWPMSPALTIALVPGLR